MLPMSGEPRSGGVEPEKATGEEHLEGKAAWQGPGLDSLDTPLHPSSATLEPRYVE